MSEKSIKVEIVDGDDKVVQIFFIDKMTVAASARRFALNADILDREGLNEQIRNQLLICSDLVPVLKDEKGKLIYPINDDGTDNGSDRMFETMDFEIFNVLAQSSIEINPPQSTLKAKKKKS